MLQARDSKNTRVYERIQTITLETQGARYWTSFVQFTIAKFCCHFLRGYFSLARLKQIDKYRIKIYSSGKKAAAAKKTAFTAPSRLKKKIIITLLGIVAHFVG